MTLREEVLKNSGVLKENLLDKLVSPKDIFDLVNNSSIYDDFEKYAKSEDYALKLYDELEELISDYTSSKIPRIKEIVSEIFDTIKKEKIKELGDNYAKKYAKSNESSDAINKYNYKLKLKGFKIAQRYNDIRTKIFSSLDRIATRYKAYKDMNIDWL